MVTGIALTFAVLSFLMACGNAANIAKLRMQVDMLLALEEDRAGIVGKAMQKVINERNTSLQ